MGFLELYHYYNTEIADKRIQDWPLIGSPVPIILISFAYLYFVLGCGPRYMEDKKPYSLQGFIRVYNLFQIVTNALIVYHSFKAGWYEDCFFYCVKPDISTTPKAYKIVSVLWYTFLLKIIDYIETFVFVLRKKNRQISFLHVYHHVSTVGLAWISMKYWAYGMSLTIVVVNNSIHVIMYTYYLLSSFGPKMQSYLQPVKRIITIMQMLQFVGLILYAMQGLLPSCSHQFYSAFTLITNLVINFILFYNFYRQNYKSKQNKKK